MFLNILNTDKFFWSNIVNQFIDSFGHSAVYIRPYELIFDSTRCFIKDFFNIFTINFKWKNLLINQEIVNPRFSDKAMSIFGAAFEYLDPEERKFFQKKLKEIFPIENYPAPSLLNPSQRKMIVKKFEEDNLHLLKVHFPNWNRDYYKAESLKQ